MRISAFILAAALAATATPALAQTTDPRLEAFKEACVPFRGDAFGAVGHLQATGWRLVYPGENAMLDEVRLKRDAHLAAEDAADGLDEGEFRYEAVETAWSKDGLILVLSRSTSWIDFSGDESLDDEEPWVHVGCNLYDYAATAPLPIEAVTAWTASLPVQSVEDAGMVGHTFNVYEMMRGTGELHVGYFAPGSEHALKWGMSGVSIAMTTSPDGMEAEEDTEALDEDSDAWLDDMAPDEDAHWDEGE